MKKTLKNIPLALLIGLSTVTSISLYAEEVVAKEAVVTEESRNGGFLKLGYGYKFEKSPYESEVNHFSMFLNGRYQWNGLFVEASYGANERNEGLSIGYNFYNTEHWNFDVSTINAHGEIHVEIRDQEKILSQHFDNTDMIGLRATGNFDQTTVQFMLAPYAISSDYDDAIYASMWLGKSWQVKNWELHGSIGLEYRSEEMLDHYYGISADEATTHFGPYEADAGIDVTAQVSASYPISSNILFESYVKYTDFSDSISDSPVMQFVGGLDDRAKARTEFGVLVNYVF
jgi:outer membrane scaffolding protein for murein synthesis (MipA/OmpV family)